MKLPKTTQQYWNFRIKLNIVLVALAGILIVWSSVANAIPDLIHVGPEAIESELRRMYEWDQEYSSQDIGLREGANQSSNDDKNGNHNHDD